MNIILIDKHKVSVDQIYGRNLRKMLYSVFYLQFTFSVFTTSYLHLHLLICVFTTLVCLVSLYNLTILISANALFIPNVSLNIFYGKKFIFFSSYS